MDRVVARQTLEAEGCSALIAMQNNGPGFVIKVKIQVADRIFVRRAADMVRIFGCDADFDCDLIRRTELRLVIAGAQTAAERKQREYQKTSFHYDLK
ncbi:hypothetical protein [uncultured Alistipes sp.]|uniref:hypothetical protein n=1 Tax=uncultured Alistipes sp. TaxID=538949 RepID=UPI00260C2853|nr:hypothetical protein [uncultured Alistipes sp.]